METNGQTPSAPGGPTANQGGAAPRPGLRWRLSHLLPQLQSDNTFYTSTQAIKGGAGAAILGGYGTGLVSAMSLPLFLAAPGMVVCGGLMGLSFYGIFLGARAGMKRMMELYSGTGSAVQPPAAPPGKPWYRKVAGISPVRRLLSARPARAVAHSRAGRLTGAASQKAAGAFQRGVRAFKKKFDKPLQLTKVNQAFGIIMRFVPVFVVVFLLTIGSGIPMGAALIAGTFLATGGGVMFGVLDSYINPQNTGLKGHARVQCLAQKPLVQKVLGNRAWQAAHSTTQKWQTYLMHSLSVNGALFWTAASTLALASRIHTFPVIFSSLMVMNFSASAAPAFAVLAQSVRSLATSITGTKDGFQNIGKTIWPLIKSVRRKNKPAETPSSVPASRPEGKAAVGRAEAAPAFNAAQKPAADGAEDKELPAPVISKGPLQGK